MHVETVVSLSHKKADTHININVEFGDEKGQIPVDGIARKAEDYRPSEKVTYKMIQGYIEKDKRGRTQIVTSDCVKKQKNAFSRGSDVLFAILLRNRLFGGYDMMQISRLYLITLKEPYLVFLASLNCLVAFRIIGRKI